jgi:pimeloyl-ACP methyl ester carboxylesterase
MVDDTIQRVSVNGITLHVQLAGWEQSGPVVLLVHGFPDDHSVWRHQVPALVQAGYRVMVPDMRGCGESDIPQGKRAYHRDALAADLLALLDHYGIDKVRLVGHDWGAAACWTLASQHPQRVERYCALSLGHLYAYMYAGREQKRAGLYTLLFQWGWLSAVLLRLNGWWLFRTLYGYPQEWPAVQARLQRDGRLRAGLGYYSSNLDLLWAARPVKVAVPVMGLWSEADRFLTEKQMTDSAALCTQGFVFHRIHAANHWLQLHQPQAVTKHLLQFFA